MADNNDRFFDQRILEMKLRDGTLTDKDLRQFLKNLPDLEGNFDDVQVPPPGHRGSSSEAPKK